MSPRRFKPLRRLLPGDRAELPREVQQNIDMEFCRTQQIGSGTALCLATRGWYKSGVVEAFAFRALSPDDPDAWRKWAAAQIAEEKHEAAIRSLETYMRLGGPSATADQEAARALAMLREMVSGRIAQSAVRE